MREMTELPASWRGSWRGPARVLSTAMLASSIALALTIVAALPAKAGDPSERPVLAFWRVDPETGQSDPIGSGFLLGPGGDVLTARHVVYMVNRYQRIMVSVGSKTGALFPVEEQKECDDALDMCFLRTSQDAIRELATTDFYRIACRQPGKREWILAYGFPKGDFGLSAPSGEVTTRIDKRNLILTSVDLMSSMSGGPVFDASGAAIAMVKGGATGELQSAIVPLEAARPYFERRGIDCTIRLAPAKRDTLKQQEISDLVALHRSIAQLLTEKTFRMIPAIEAYVRAPSDGRWQAVRAAARDDRAAMTQAERAAIEFLSRYDGGGTAEVEILLASAADGAAPAPAPRPDLSGLRAMFDTMADKGGTLDEIGQTRAAPDPEIASGYLTSLRGFADTINGQLTAAVAAYETWVRGL